MIFSNTAITVDIAAKNIKRKNSVPKIRLPGILLNTLGSVIKSSSGPLPGSIPKEKQAGKMMSPADSATKVSKRMTQTASPVRRFFFSM